jgi:hypothetical protein
MYGEVMGTTVPGYEDGGRTWDTCDVNGIANPDNITYLPGYDSLIIGEDTGSGHRNDVVRTRRATWATSSSRPSPPSTGRAAGSTTGTEGRV